MNKFMCRVYVVGSDYRVFGHDEHLLTILGQTYSKGFKDYVTGDVVAGVIALILTITICYLAIPQGNGASRDQIPDVLANALTAILGFYFGRSTVK